MMRMIDPYLKGVEVRRTVFNWPEQIKAIVDGYRSYTTVPHAVQKDAIQNGWSARRSKKGREWSLTFELIEKKGKTFLLMIDSGTTGLTGKILTPEEYELDLPSEEKWGRFEGVAFTQPREERTLGSRGRGKFIFVGASKEHTILYDTLRDDGIYRFGFRTVIKTESPIAAYENDEGRNRMKEMTGGIIEPLDRIGTTIIIVEPIDELVEDIKNGNFLRHIGETWWEIILKRDANITLKVDGKKFSAKILDDFALPEKDSSNFRVWIRRNEKFPMFRIRKLHMVYNSQGKVPEDIRGIAIQRGGMKICNVELRYMGREIAERIYGYINLDSSTEESLLEDEGIEHYFYDFRRSLPGAIRRYIEDELLRFAQKKLGYRVDEREVRRQQQRNAERRALVAANNFARTLGLGAGPGVTKRGNGGERVPGETRIQMEELVLPRPGDLRVNYEETVKNIKIRIINESSQDVYVRVKVFLRYFDKLIKPFTEQDIEVKADSKSQDFGPFEETFLENRYPDSGKYTVVAKIVSLRDEDKGTELDYKTKSFYLEEDPPQGGLFERCEAMRFPGDEPMKYWMGYSEYGSERGLILNYNLNHPSYSPVSENEEDLLTEYILRIAGQEICRFDLLQESPVLFNENQRDDPQEILKQERKIVGEALFKFRTGEI